MSKQTVKLQRINIKNFACPICNTIGEYLKDDNEETYCTQCGCIIDSPYPYTAGIRYNTISDFQIEKQNQKIEQRFKKMRKRQRWKKQWKQTTYQPMQHG